MKKIILPPQPLYIAYIERSKDGQFFARLVNARNKRKPIWNTETYKRVGTALKAVTKLPIAEGKMKIIDKTGLL